MLSLAALHLSVEQKTDSLLPVLGLGLSLGQKSFPRVQKTPIEAELKETSNLNWFTRKMNQRR